MASSGYSYVIQVVLIVAAALNFLLSLFKFVGTIKGGGCCPFKLGQTVILIIVVSELERIVYYSLDPLNMREILRVDIQLYLYQLTVSSYIAATCLIILNWNNATIKDKCMNNHQWLIYVPLAISLAMGIIFFPILVNLIDGFYVTIFAAFLYLFTSLIFAIYMLATAPRVIRFVQKKTLENVKKRLLKKTKWIFITGILAIIWCIPPILILIPIRGDPYYFNTCLFTWILIVEIMNFTELMSFSPSLKDFRKKGTKEYHVL